MPMLILFWMISTLIFRLHLSLDLITVSNLRTSRNHTHLYVVNFTNQLATFYGPKVVSDLSNFFFSSAFFLSTIYPLTVWRFIPCFIPLYLVILGVLLAVMVLFSRVFFFVSITITLAISVFFSRHYFFPDIKCKCYGLILGTKGFFWQAFVYTLFHNTFIQYLCCCLLYRYIAFHGIWLPSYPHPPTPYLIFCFCEASMVTFLRTIINFWHLVI